MTCPLSTGQHTGPPSAPSVDPASQLLPYGSGDASVLLTLGLEMLAARNPLSLRSDNTESGWERVRKAQKWSQPTAVTRVLVGVLLEMADNRAKAPRPHQVGYPNRNSLTQMNHAEGTDQNWQRCHCWKLDLMGFVKNQFSIR